MSNGYWMANEPLQMGSSSGASCTNQTHSGGAFYADIASGNDSWAGTSDCPTASIQAAVDLAGQGDSVIVMEGVYHEEITLAEAGMRLQAAAGERLGLELGDVVKLTTAV